MIEVSDHYSPFVKQWHLCYYIPGNSNDALTKHVLEFKNGDNGCIKCWSNWMADELQKTGISFDFVLRSLGSSELTASSIKPLDHLGKHAERQLNFSYLPTMISKTRATQKLSSIPRKADRETELQDVYKLSDNCPNLSGKKVLLLDDVATSGTTSKAIIKVIKAKYPTCQCYLLTLAKTKREDDANEGISLKFFQ